MNTSLRHIDREKLAQIAKKHGLVFVVLFGSKARGEKRNEESDLDIAVLTKKKPTYRVFGKVFSEISDVFRGENADVRFLNDTDLTFRSQVVRDGILLFGDEKQYQDYTLHVVRQYVDDGKKYFPMLDRFLMRKQEILESRL